MSAQQRRWDKRKWVDKAFHKANHKDIDYWHKLSAEDRAWLESSLVDLSGSTNIHEYRQNKDARQRDVYDNCEYEAIEYDGSLTVGSRNAMVDMLIDDEEAEALGGWEAVDEIIERRDKQEKKIKTAQRVAKIKLRKKTNKL